MGDLQFIQHIVECVKQDENVDEGVCLYLWDWPETLELIVDTNQDYPSDGIQKKLSEALFADALASQAIVRRIGYTRSIG